MKRALSILTLTLGLGALNACAAIQSPIGPSVEIETDTPTVDVAEAPVRQTCLEDDLGVYNPDTDQCEQVPVTVPPPSTTPNTCLEDDSGIYNPETDLCEPL